MNDESQQEGVSAPQLYQGSTFHDNTRQAVIRVTEDKLRYYLMEFCQHAAVRNSWLTPFSLLVAIITTFATTNFIGRWGLSADSWAAIFAILGLLSLIWLVLSLINIARFWRKGDLESVLKRIKSQ